MIDNITVFAGNLLIVASPFLLGLLIGLIHVIVSAITCGDYKLLPKVVKKYPILDIENLFNASFILLVISSITWFVSMMIVLPTSGDARDMGVVIAYSYLVMSVTALWVFIMRTLYKTFRSKVND